eukprot:Nk52_evm28s914 gene=Nk52_evmTU28s914
MAGDYRQLKECAQRQVDEVEVIRSMYPDEFAFETGEATFETLKVDLEQSEDAINIGRVSSGASVFAFSLCIRFLDSEECDEKDKYEIKVTFEIPSGYPLLESASMGVSSSSLERKVCSDMASKIKEHCESHQGNEVGLTVLEFVQEAFPELVKGLQTKATSTKAEKKAETVRNRKTELAVCLFWMHHIKSTTKRKNIIAWSNELSLRGYSKPGYPGIVVVEGENEDVSEYIRRLKALKWKAIAVRCHQLFEIESGKSLEEMRHIGDSMCELETMSQLSERMRLADLEDIMMSALKLTK